MAKIFVALSGGVDSAVAALLLKKQGYEIYGVHMQNWDVEINEGIIRNGEVGCSGKEDLNYVKEVCRILDIPLYKYSFIEEYWEMVFEDYLEDLRKDLNTNPDIKCNSKIKFGVLLESLKKDFKEDIFLATGHWAKIIKKNDRYYLGMSKNVKKDQTYFLSSLTEKQLSQIIFPLSEIETKEELRNIAKENNLPVWNKKDSVGICFIGKRNYKNFMSNYLNNKEGDFVDIETGEILGKHKGTHLYVLHQRSGLYLKGYLEKYYVCEKDLKNNKVFLCRESKLKEFLHKSTTTCVDINWINDPIPSNTNIYIKTRHSPNFMIAKIIYLDDKCCVLSHEKTYITSPGQRIVFYDLNKKICLGGGMYIKESSSVSRIEEN